MSDVTHLHCSFCGEAHRFTRSEVEQIVYVLLGTVSDLIDHDDHREWAKAVRDNPYQTYDHLVCLREVRGSADDIEQWSEWVESLVECRRASASEQPIDGPRETTDG